jgi:FlaA1/EpsC-like NDP-sugar epimerase
MERLYNNILIFGGTGSLGTTLVKLWLPKSNSISVYSRDEFKHWKIKQDYKVKNIIGDINDYTKVLDAIIKTNPTLIVLASAMKHIDQCEINPKDCIDTNVYGLIQIMNALDTAYYILKDTMKLQRFLFVSTDKACEPISIYGMSKSISEHIIQTRVLTNPNIKSMVVRYGNVINSNGSILQIFNKQLNQSYFTVTDDTMTRFFMTLEDSVHLIEDAIEYGDNKEIWIPMLQSMKIIDLAQIYSEKYNKPIKFIGLRCNEKIHETLISSEEFKKTIIKTGSVLERYVITDVNQKDPIIATYISDSNLLSKEELYQMIQSHL